MVVALVSVLTTPTPCSCCVCCCCRWISLQAVLGLNPNALQQLLAKEPRLLMPSSKALAQNHTDIISTLNISHSTLTRWICAAPMLLLVPAAQLRKRLAVIADVLRDEADDLLALLAQRASLQPHQQQQPQQQQQAGSGAVAGATAMAGAGSPQAAAAAVSSSSGVPWVSVASDALQVLAYVNKDPRVLLLSPYEVQQKLSQLSNELGLGLWVAGWLLMSHPSYLAMEPGLATTWMQDVRHLADVTQLQAKRLAACPQVSRKWSLAPQHMCQHTVRMQQHGAGRNTTTSLRAWGRGRVEASSARMSGMNGAEQGRARQSVWSIHSTAQHTTAHHSTHRMRQATCPPTRYQVYSPATVTQCSFSGP